MKLPFYKDLKPSKDEASLKIMHTDTNSIDHIAGRLMEALERISADQPVVVVCVGTDRSTGDALGPLVGTHLKKFGLKRLHLYGTLENPVHAMNLNETLNTIFQHFHNPFIIGVDACLGQLTSVGCIQIGDGPVKPGAGVNKELPPVGHMHVTGIVNVGGFMEYFVLQNTRLSLVMSMAEVIANSFHTALLGRQPRNANSFAGIE